MSARSTNVIAVLHKRKRVVRNEFVSQIGLSTDVRPIQSYTRGPGLIARKV